MQFVMFECCCQLCYFVVFVFFGKVQFQYGVYFVILNMQYGMCIREFCQQMYFWCVKQCWYYVDNVIWFLVMLCYQRKEIVDGKIVEM